MFILRLDKVVARVGRYPQPALIPSWEASCAPLCAVRGSVGLQQEIVNGHVTTARSFSLCEDVNRKLHSKSGMKVLTSILPRSRVDAREDMVRLREVRDERAEQILRCCAKATPSLSQLFAAS
jgi:hypothetical protein